MVLHGADIDRLRSRRVGAGDGEGNQPNVLVDRHAGGGDRICDHRRRHRVVVLDGEGGGAEELRDRIGCGCLHDQAKGLLGLAGNRIVGDGDTDRLDALPGGELHRLVELADIVAVVGGPLVLHGAGVQRRRRRRVGARDGEGDEPDVLVDRHAGGGDGIRDRRRRHRVVVDDGGGSRAGAENGTGRAEELQVEGLVALGQRIVPQPHSHRLHRLARCKSQRRVHRIVVVDARPAGQGPIGNRHRLRARTAQPNHELGIAGALVDNDVLRSDGRQRHRRLVARPDAGGAARIGQKRAGRVREHQIKLLGLLGLCIVGDRNPHRLHPLARGEHHGAGHGREVRRSGGSGGGGVIDAHHRGARPIEADHEHRLAHLLVDHRVGHANHRRAHRAVVVDDGGGSRAGAENGTGRAEELQVEGLVALGQRIVPQPHSHRLHRLARCKSQRRVHRIVVVDARPAGQGPIGNRHRLRARTAQPNHELGIAGALVDNDVLRSDGRCRHVRFPFCPLVVPRRRRTFRRPAAVRSAAGGARSSPIARLECLIVAFVLESNSYYLISFAWCILAITIEIQKILLHNTFIVCNLGGFFAAILYYGLRHPHVRHAGTERLC